jgi:hypothetical protein
LTGGVFAADFKFGLLLHFGIPTFQNPGEQGMVPAARFAPTGLDVKQWARTAKEVGMTFAVLTAKHESGFCLWDSADYDYDIAKSGVKTDVIGDFISACEAESIAPGVDYSIVDSFNEGEARRQGPVPPPYFSVIKKHITELHTKYPGLRVQILGSSHRLSASQWEQLKEIIHRLNPACVILDWTRPPIYGTQTAIKGWMWSANAGLNTPEFLFNVYSGRMKTGAAWLGSVGVDRTGKIPDNQVAVLLQLKKLIANRPLAGSTASAGEGKADTAERLRKLQSLYDQRLIDKEDYDKKKKEIMDSL